MVHGQREYHSAMSTPERLPSMPPLSYQGMPDKDTKNLEMHTIPLDEPSECWPPRDNSATVSAPRELPPRPSEPARDGGSLAWRQVVAAFLVAFNCFGLPLAFGTVVPHYQPYYRSRIGEKSAPLLAWIGSTQLSLPFICAPLFGRMYDRSFGCTFYGGTFALLLATLLTYFSANLAVTFVLQGLVTGMTLGLLCCTYNRVLCSWFQKNLELALGVISVGACAGGITYSSIIPVLLHKKETGIQQAFSHRLFIMFPTLLLANTMLRPWPGKQKKRERKTKASNFSIKNRLDISFWLALVGLFFSFLVLPIPYFYVTFRYLIRGSQDANSSPDHGVCHKSP